MSFNLGIQTETSPDPTFHYMDSGPTNPTSIQNPNPISFQTPNPTSFQDPDSTIKPESTRTTIFRSETVGTAGLVLGLWEKEIQIFRYSIDLILTLIVLG